MIATLPRSTPEGQGVDSALLLDLVDRLDASAQELHSLMVLRHGHVVAEGWWAPYERDKPHALYSLSKSFTSVAVGLAVAEGRFGIDDHVVDYFPDHLPAEVSDNLRAMRVRDLLTMTAGHVDEAVIVRGRKDSWLTAFFAQSVEKQPGTHFLYNTAATYVLSALVQRRTGSTVLDYLKPRLFDKLGITEQTWPTSPEGVTIGGFGLSLTTESVAKFGQLLLENDGSVLPADWVTQATSKQVPNGEDNADWQQGYGFQFWQGRRGYRGDGAFGQFCVVLADLDMVIVTTAATYDMQAVLDTIWSILPAELGDALPVDDAASSALADKLASLELPPPQGGELPAQLRGRTYAIEPGEGGQGLTRLVLGDTVEAEITFPAETFRVTAGNGAWAGAGDVLASGVWEDGGYVLTVRWITTPYCATISCRFDGDRIEVDTTLNVVIGQLVEHVAQEGKRV